MNLKRNLENGNIFGVFLFLSVILLLFGGWKEWQRTSVDRELCKNLKAYDFDAAKNLEENESLKNTIKQDENKIASLVFEQSQTAIAFNLRLKKVTEQRDGNVAEVQKILSAKDQFTELQNFSRKYGLRVWCGVSE